jgi:hypothetical protein
MFLKIVGIGIIIVMIYAVIDLIKLIREDESQDESDENF